MKFQTEELLNDLTQRTKQVIETAGKYRDLDIGQLNFKPAKDRWSILECLEHLNLYGDFYLPEIEQRILQSKSEPSAEFRSGVIGNYFAKLMQPKPDGTVKKMKSPKDKTADVSKLSKATIERFLKQQDYLLKLLEMARKVDLTKTKTAISISTIVKLRLGDTFRFYTYHIERHIAQAERLH
jgi:hypothetical protein